MNIAYLITAHKNPNQLERLVNKLNSEKCDIFIHIDTKSDCNSYSNIFKIKNVFDIKNRINIKWGGYSQVQATINSVCEILETGNQYDYIHFISGQDYPIKPLHQFYKFLEQNKGNEYLEFIHENERPEVTRKRIYQYNFNEFDFKGKFILQKLVNMILPEKKFPIKNYEIVWKANWFTITPDAAGYVIDFLKSNPKVVHFFKYCWGVDEFVFQTILYNSNFKDKIINNNYRYVDWGSGEASPKTLTITDYEKLTNNENFFARKFDSKIDVQILDKIDDELLRN